MTESTSTEGRGALDDPSGGLPRGDGTTTFVHALLGADVLPAAVVLLPSESEGP